MLICFFKKELAMEFFFSKKMSQKDGKKNDKKMGKKIWREEESAVWKIALSRECECEKWIHSCFWRSSDCGRPRRGRTDGPSDEQMGSQEEKAEVLIQNVDAPLSRSSEREP